MNEYSTVIGLGMLPDTAQKKAVEYLPFEPNSNKYELIKMAPPQRLEGGTWQVVINYRVKSSVNLDSMFGIN